MRCLSEQAPNCVATTLVPRGRTRELETERIRYPRASWIAFDAVEQLAKGAPGDAASVVPIYLRGSQAETARGGG
jgi:tRNA A37 threonylcarbamoyladenosine modification protein TsaB